MATQNPQQSSNRPGPGSIYDNLKNPSSQLPGAINALRVDLSTLSESLTAATEDIKFAARDMAEAANSISRKIAAETTVAEPALNRVVKELRDNNVALIRSIRESFVEMRDSLGKKNALPSSAEQRLNRDISRLAANSSETAKQISDSIAKSKNLDPDSPETKVLKEMVEAIEEQNSGRTTRRASRGSNWFGDDESLAGDIPDAVKDEWEHSKKIRTIGTTSKTMGVLYRKGREGLTLSGLGGLAQAKLETGGFLSKGLSALLGSATKGIRESADAKKDERRIQVAADATLNSGIGEDIRKKIRSENSGISDQELELEAKKRALQLARLTSEFQKEKLRQAEVDALLKDKRSETGINLTHTEEEKARRKTASRSYDEAIGLITGGTVEDDEDDSTVSRPYRKYGKGNVSSSIGDTDSKDLTEYSKTTSIAVVEIRDLLQKIWAQMNSLDNFEKKNESGEGAGGGPTVMPSQEQEDSTEEESDGLTARSRRLLGGVKRGLRKIRVLGKRGFRKFKRFGAKGLKSVVSGTKKLATIVKAAPKVVTAGGALAASKGMGLFNTVKASVGGAVNVAKSSKVANFAVKALGVPLALGQTAYDVSQTDTSEYAKRFGFKQPSSFLGDLGVRGLGAASDLGNVLTFGLAGDYLYRDKQAQTPIVDVAATKAENATSSQVVAAMSSKMEDTKREERLKEATAVAPGVTNANKAVINNTTVNNATVVAQDIRNQEPSYRRNDSGRFVF